jgi:hypothetical protein
VIDTSELLNWALVVFSSIAGSANDRPTFSQPSFYESHASCVQAGERLMAAIDVSERARVGFACVPREVLRNDLAMRPEPHH